MKTLYIYRFVLGYATVSVFPFAHELIELNRKGHLMNLSCHDRCIGTNERIDIQMPPITDCSCDPYCLFFGDCCYDYLLQCKSDMYTNLDSALKEQFELYQRFSKYTSCRKISYQENFFGEPMRVVDKCPTNMNDTNRKAFCRAEVGYRTLASFIPVVANNIVYLNSYCAACHGILMREIEMISEEYGISCYQRRPSTCPWAHLCQDLECPIARVNISRKYNWLFDRSRIQCTCEIVHPYKNCTREKYLECQAYKTIYEKYAVVVNQACLACLQEQSKCPPGRQPTVERYERHLFKQLFKFTESARPNMCPLLYDIGYVGNQCLVTTCQTGHILHSNKCISFNESAACFAPNENHYSPKYQIANLYHPALMICMEREEWKRYKLSKTDENKNDPEENKNDLLDRSQPCGMVKQDIYWNLIFASLPANTECRMLFMAALSFTSVMQMVESGTFGRNYLPGIDVLYFIMINHDPIVGLNCSGGISFEIITHRANSSFRAIEYRTRNINKVFMTNRDPIIISKSTGKEAIKAWALFCLPNTNKMGCPFLNITQYNYRTCPKYKLIDLTVEEQEHLRKISNTSQLDTGYTISDDETAFICADIYEKLVSKTFDSKIMNIIVSVSYTLSLICLMATFSIHVRFHILRTLPGLMLMNLIMALFVAQLLYLLNAFNLFIKPVILCQVMATFQLYFWLASFVWMACMSLDIFNCLSTSCPAVVTYTASKYYRYVVIAWVAPLPLPLIALTLTNTDASDIGYDLTQCWLNSGRSVLFFFAVPVLTIVTINLAMFIGSVWRLGSLMENATIAGRKEDNKRRLIQCTKLASWMGLSWLFGIIPNFWDFDSLWYVFVLVNALQGVHIFLAFGISGKVRGLRRDMSESNGTRTDQSNTT